MEHKIDIDITLLRKLNIKIDIINNHIQYSLLKTDIYIKRFGKVVSKWIYSSYYINNYNRNRINV